MVNILEHEEKYIISNPVKNGLWDNELIIYQWYIEGDLHRSIKNKIIFNLIQAKVTYVRVTKAVVILGEANKNIEYLNINDFKPEEMLGIPFVLKRRAISNKVFLDKFIVSNGITEYLLEYEGDDQNNIELQKFGLLKNVTSDRNYYNQNMCIPFTQKDAEYLKFLLNVYLF